MTRTDSGYAQAILSSSISGVELTTTNHCDLIALAADLHTVCLANSHPARRAAAERVLPAPNTPLIANPTSFTQGQDNSTQSSQNVSIFELENRHVVPFVPHSHNRQSQFQLQTSPV